LPAYVDSAYFLLYNDTSRHSGRNGTVTADLVSRGAGPTAACIGPRLQEFAVEILNQPLFNRRRLWTTSFRRFVLILQRRC